MEGEAVRQEVRRSTAEVTEAKIAKTLFSLDITPGIKGYAYVLYAIQYKIKNPFVSMKELYMETGKQFDDVGYERVERSIRHAIQKGYYKGDADVWAKHFRECPPNNEFIARIAEILHLGLDE